ncbi:MAG: heavy-metal-associated domain-containing protein [Prevotellaceae bacterium]|jgi:copper chaperone CopZ|nr:heavy-metal-associated domain-containing protein [Prevotellaceae bacterium]
MKRSLLVVLLIFCTVAGAIGQDKKDDKKKKKVEEVTFTVSMFCGNCQAKVERHIAWEKGVKDLKVNLDKKTVTIKYDPSKTTEEALKKAIEGLEFTCEKAEETPPAPVTKKEE